MLMLLGSCGALSHTVHVGDRLLASGGGLTPWALIAGLASRSIGAATT